MVSLRSQDKKTNNLLQKSTYRLYYAHNLMNKNQPIFDDAWEKRQYILDTFLEMLCSRSNETSEVAKKKELLELRAYARAHKIPNWLYRISQYRSIERTPDC